MSLVISMDKQELIDKWNNVKKYIDSNNINGYTQDIKVYIRNTGLIIALTMDTTTTTISNPLTMSTGDTISL